MALISALLTFVVLLCFVLAFTCAGSWILARLRIALDSEEDHLVVAVATGVISTEILIFLALLTQHIRTGCIFVVGLLCLPLTVQLKSVTNSLLRILASSYPKTRLDRFLYITCAAVLAIEFLTAIAPLSGSDAMHYHFTVPKLIIQNGFHPIFFLSHNFLVGQGHLLILLGLALGSEKLALAFLFLGGALTALTLVCLAKRWVSGASLPAIFLLFLVTPVIFWQITSSATPDIWMALFAGAAAITLTQKSSAGTWQQACLAGFLAGGIAGAKYTGCIVAASILIAFLVEFRSLAKSLLFLLAALVPGVWPYARNYVWIGDPVFPFLTKRLFPIEINPFTLGIFLSDTGASAPRHLYQVFPFVFFAGLRSNNLGFWDFYGPIILSSSPLILFAFRNNRPWRVPLIIWFVSATGIFFTSGMARFLLPVFAIALACVPAGIQLLKERDWRMTRFVVLTSVAASCAVGILGLILFSRAAVSASLGITSRIGYLSANVQDFQLAQTINQTINAQSQPGKTMVFFRHTYYLQIPFFNGNPDDSWSVNPDRLRTPAEWNAFFASQDIRYVVRSPAYPPPISAPLTELETRGDLLPIAKTEVENLRGMRLSNDRRMIPVVILKVKE